MARKEYKKQKDIRKKPSKLNSDTDVITVLDEDAKFEEDYLMGTWVYLYDPNGIWIAYILDEDINKGNKLKNVNKTLINN